MGIELLPKTILEKYEVYEWKHACAILKNDFPNEWEDLINLVHCRATDDQPADDAACREQCGFGKELCHDAAPLHANGGKDADLARAFKHRHHQRVRDDRGCNSQHDQIQHNKERICIILEHDHELILFLPREHPKVR